MYVLLAAYYIPYRVYSIVYVPGMIWTAASSSVGLDGFRCGDVPSIYGLLSLHVPSIIFRTFSNKSPSLVLRSRSFVSSIRIWNLISTETKSKSAVQLTAANIYRTHSALIAFRLYMFWPGLKTTQEYKYIYDLCLLHI